LHRASPSEGGDQRTTLWDKGFRLVHGRGGWTRICGVETVVPQGVSEWTRIWTRPLGPLLGPRGELGGEWWCWVVSQVELLEHGCPLGLVGADRPVHGRLRDAGHLAELPLGQAPPGTPLDVEELGEGDGGPVVLDGPGPFAAALEFRWPLPLVAGAAPVAESSVLGQEEAELGPA